ncbi:unnamed protein product, partial [Musa acuminata var. zebrina]
MQVEPPLGDRPVLGRHRRGGRRRRRIWLRRPVEGIWDQRRDRAKGQRRQVQHAGGEDLRLPPRGEGRRAHRGVGVGTDEGGDQRTYHLQVLEAAAALVELESRLLGAGGPRGGWDRVLGRRRRGAGRVLGDRLGGARQHLDYLLEGTSVGLDEGGGVRIGVDGSGHGRGSEGHGRRGCRCGHPVAAAAAATAAGGGVGGGGIGRLDFLLLVPMVAIFHLTDVPEERGRKISYFVDSCSDDTDGGRGGSERRDCVGAVVGFGREEGVKKGDDIDDMLNGNL